jgi:hypothetical protein
MAVAANSPQQILNAAAIGSQDSNREGGVRAKNGGGLLSSDKQLDSEGGGHGMRHAGNSFALLGYTFNIICIGAEFGGCAAAWNPGTHEQG